AADQTRFLGLPESIREEPDDPHDGRHHRPVTAADHREGTYRPTGRDPARRADLDRLELCLQARNRPAAPFTWVAREAVGSTPKPGSILQPRIGSSSESGAYRFWLPAAPPASLRLSASRYCPGVCPVSRLKKRLK